MNREDIEKTFPANTVYLYKENGIVKRANSFNYYVNLGQDYKACCEALKRSPMYTEVQDETLYQVVLLLEKAQTRKKSEIDIVDKLQEIAYQLDDVIDDLEEQRSDFLFRKDDEVICPSCKRNVFVNGDVLISEAKELVRCKRCRAYVRCEKLQKVSDCRFEENEQLKAQIEKLRQSSS